MNFDFFRCRCVDGLFICSWTSGTEIGLFEPKSAVDGVGQGPNGEHIKYEVFVADYQRVIDEENPPQEEIARVQGRNGMKVLANTANMSMMPHFTFSSSANVSDLIAKLLLLSIAHKLTWHVYHRLDDIYSFLDHLVETYSELCSIETIGRSVEGRPLKVIK